MSKKHMSKRIEPHVCICGKGLGKGFRFTINVLPRR